MRRLSEITLPDMCGGLNTNDPQYDIADNQSPDMLNLWYKDKALCKRPGQAIAVNLPHVYRISEVYNGFRIVHAGIKLYKWDEAGARLYKGMLDASQMGYPAAASPGDYYIISKAGVIDGVSYSAGDRALYYPSNVQKATTTVIGTVTTGGTLFVTVTAVGLGEPVNFTIDVEKDCTAEKAAAMIRSELGKSTALRSLYIVEGENAEIALCQIAAEAYDSTLNVSIACGSCIGIVDTPLSQVTSMWHNAIEEIYSGIADRKGVFVEFGDVLYHVDGTEIWQINGQWGVSAVKPYDPVIMINCKPDLSESTDNEPFNLLGNGFCIKYNGDANTSVYRLPFSDLDGIPAKVTVDGKDKTEGTHYTYDKASGIITFLPGNTPGTGTNNIWITAYKTVSGNKNKITGCKSGIAFGGESGGLAGGTRVFMTANPSYPLSHWHSDIGLHVGNGMAYFPDTSEEYLDQNSDSITAAAKMGKELVVFKRNSIFAMRYAYDGQDAYFPVRECNNTVGCDIPDSVQLIDNKLVFANTRTGVHMLISTSNESEELVKPISANINNLLLQESKLEYACSCDYERYYWLCVNGRVYLWDYGQTPYYNYSDYDQAQRRLAWYRFDNINASTFAVGQALYYNTPDGIAYLNAVKDDFGKPYESYFISKAFDLGRPEELKTFMFAYPSFSPDAGIKARVTVDSEDIDEAVSRDFDIKSFAWDNWNWDAFTWNAIKYAKTFSMRLGMRNVSYVQIKVSGNESGRGAGLSGLRITYYTNKKIKR